MHILEIVLADVKQWVLQLYQGLKCSDLISVQHNLQLQHGRPDSKTLCYRYRERLPSPSNWNCNWCACVCLQCHEACIAIYSSMENQKLSHWVGISVLSMFFCLLIYTLTGEFTSEDHSASCAHIWKLPVTSTLCTSRCLRLHDVWTRRRFRHFDVISGKWCGHDHLQTSFWNIDHHHLSHYSSPGEVSSVRAGL